MTIPPLPQGTQNFRGANGALLASGTVQFYIPRTSFGKTTWTSPSQATANANPVLLDASGGATIYGWSGYRQIVKDASGNTIWDSQTQGGPFTLNTIVLNIHGSNNFTVPAGVYSLYVEVVGAGGSGSNCTAAAANGDVSGGGGGAGGYSSSLVAVTPHQVIPYSVGKGGDIGAQEAGGLSSWSTTIICNGGKGSSFLVQGTSAGGTGGTSNGGSINNFDGGWGWDGSHIPSSGGAPYRGPGNGGKSYYGDGGTAQNGGDGNSGTSPGSGGGGAMDVNLTGAFLNGGAGADGQVLVMYWN